MEVVCQVGADQLDLASRCEGWTIRQVLGHSHGVTRKFADIASARTIDLAVGERHERPILRRCDGQRLDRRTAHRRVDPRTTTIYDRRRQNFDRHAAYVVAFVAGS